MHFVNNTPNPKNIYIILKELTGVYTSGEHVVYFNITCKTLLAWRVKAGGLELKYDIVLCIMKCWWKAWRVKGGGLELKYGHCSLHWEMLMEGMEGPFSIEWRACFSHVILFVDVYKRHHFFLFSKKRQQVDIVGPMEFLGNHSKYNIVYHKIEYRNQILIGVKWKYLKGKQNWYCLWTLYMHYGSSCWCKKILCCMTNHPFPSERYITLIMQFF